MVLIQYGGFGQRSQASSTRSNVPPTGLAALGQQALELRHIQPYGLPGVRVQADLLPVGQHPTLPHGLINLPQRVAQISQAPARVMLRPEQRDQRFAGMALPGHSQVGQQGERLPAIGFHRPAIQFQARGAEQTYSQAGHGRGPLFASDYIPVFSPKRFLTRPPTRSGNGRGL